MEGKGKGDPRFHTRYDEEVPHHSNPVVKTRNPLSGGETATVPADSHEDVVILGEPNILQLLHPSARPVPICETVTQGRPWGLATLLFHPPTYTNYCIRRKVDLPGPQ